MSVTDEKTKIGKRRANTQNWQGAPTVLLYLGLFGCVGCLGLFLFALLTGVFFWGWMRFGEVAGLSHLIPSSGGRIGLGVLLYLVIVGALGFKFRPRPNRTQAQAQAEAVAKRV